MAETLLKSVRLTDNLKLDVYQQGKRRKYALFNDENNTKSEKYDVALSDDNVIKEALYAYNKIKYPIGNQEYYKVVQDPYKEPYKKRYYGTGNPYYLNNGCAICIKWLNNNLIIGSEEDNAHLKNVYTKNVSILKVDTGNDDKSGFKSYMITTQRGMLDYVDRSYENGDREMEYESSMLDYDIIKNIITQFNTQVNYISEIKYGPDYLDLKLCDPDTELKKTIKYIDPIIPVPSEKTINQTISEETPKSVPKNKLIIDGLPEEIKIKAKESLPIFTIWTGHIPKNNDYYSELGELDEEYMESEYQGLEETGIDFGEWIIQDSISSSQENCANYSEIEGYPVDIKSYSSLDSLLKLAGKCARELGKNPRVKYENLRSGYKEGIHGLCPQGTLSVLYALTGIKILGKISGNADWFSFKNPTNPKGGESKGDFSKTGYYNQKQKITQINGSWKGTYLHNGSKNQWQIGDIVAMGYTNEKNYGHIQVWTGFCWMSDFKQNSIQQNHVDVNSVALWRLSSKGIEAVNKQKS